MWVLIRNLFALACGVVLEDNQDAAPDNQMLVDDSVDTTDIDVDK